LELLNLTRDPISNILQTTIVAMDALVNTGGRIQFNKSSFKRDLTKAYCASYVPNVNKPTGTFATGNWGMQSIIF
jgi:hypothetical protein